MKTSYSQHSLISHNGETKTLKEWADFCGIGWKSMWVRLQTKSPQEAIEYTPFSALCEVEGCLNPAHYGGRRHCNTHHYRIRRNGTLKLKNSLSDEEKFWANVTKSDSGCWMFSIVGRTPYGSMNFRGKATLANRVSWILHNGEIPHGLFVCHTCDVPGCVNPAHLFLGTCADNVRDMHAKGRARPPRGNQNHNAKLTDCAVREIRQKRADGYRAKDLAKDYGVHVCVIYGIVNKKTWRHVA